MKATMNDLWAELRKLGADVEEIDSAVGRIYPTVNGVKIDVDMREKNGKVIFLVGDKSFTTVKNAAYFILGEWVPRQRTHEELDKVIEELRSVLPPGVGLYRRLDDRYGISLTGVKDAEHLKTAILHMAEHLDPFAAKMERSMRGDETRTWEQVNEEE